MPKIKLLEVGHLRDIGHGHSHDCLQVFFRQQIDERIAVAHVENVGVIQDGIMLNFRALSHRGTIDIYESRAYGEALGKLTDKDFGDDRKAWAAWYKNERREAKKRRARSE